MSRILIFVPLFLFACAEAERDRPSVAVVDLDPASDASWVDSFADEDTADRLASYARAVPDTFMIQCDVDVDVADAYCVNEVTFSMVDAIDACAFEAGVPAAVVEEQRGAYWSLEPSGDAAADEHLERLQALQQIPLTCRVSTVDVERAHETLAFAYWVGTCD